MNRLRELRTQKGLNMKETAQALGLPYTTYVNYEKGTREPNSETLILLADFYGTSIDYMLGKDVEAPDTSIPAGFEPLPATRLVPLYSAIACGTPIFADSNIEAMVPMPENVKADFAVRCKGDSMTGARILDGDLVFIRKQPTVENGEIAAVLVGEAATLKRFYQYGDTVVLRAENPAYKELTYAGTQLAELQIMGKAVAFLSRVS